MPKNGSITLRVIDGSDRGRIYSHLVPPITIGREEGNTIQLNDERVSRYHLKIQEDHDRIVLTDLESTNGTRVNAEDVSLRILRFGDLIMLGRSVLLYGSREEIAERLMQLREKDVNEGATLDPSSMNQIKNMSALDFEINYNQDAPSLQGSLHAMQPPEIPDRLSPGQAAQLSELLEFFHIRLRNLINTVETEEDISYVHLELAQWQNIIDLQAKVAEYLKRISSPE
jgi:pSer/pThr/pTyr-binding forkhead associated (FHA) protein